MPVRATLLMRFLRKQTACSGRCAVSIVFTPSAKRQFLSAIAHIHADKPGAARAFRRKAESSLRRLSDFPDSGRRLPEFPELPYREIIVAPYRFFYREHDDVIWVVAVWHSAQLPDEPPA